MFIKSCIGGQFSGISVNSVANFDGCWISAEETLFD